ncbi:MAG: transglutaminase domain-containing protein [Candidatus Margulisiibacteriota bacterium]
MNKKMVQSCFLILLGFCFLMQLALVAAAETNQEFYSNAQALEKSGDLVQAVQIMQQLIGSEPQNDLYLAYASHVERLAGDYKNGLEHAQAAVKINPNVPWYYVSIALNAYGKGDIYLTKEFGKKVVELGSAAVGEGNYDNVSGVLKNLEGRKFVITWTLDPAKGYKKNGQSFFPLPSTDLPYQTAKYSITGAADVLLPPTIRIPYKEAKYSVPGVKNLNQVDLDGNTVAYVTPIKGKNIILTATVETRAFSYRDQLESYSMDTIDEDLPVDAQIYLGKSEGIDPNSAVIQEIVAGIKQPSKVDTIKNILSWLKKNITYKVVDYKNVDDIVQRGYGECGGYSALFTALARGVGVPARVVWGMVEENDPKMRFAPAGHLKGHAWAEFYLHGKGWIPVEPQAPETLGMLPTTYIKMYNYAMKDTRWTTVNFNPSNNMVLMGGDIPEYK